MKNYKLFFYSSLIFILLAIPINSFSLDYTITFTGSGASSTVGSVIVQNLTKGTTVTVPSGNVLNLTDLTTSFDYINSNTDKISIFPNPIQVNATLSFVAKNDGNTLINAFSLEGKKVFTYSKNTLGGINSFNLELPKGIYTIQIKGNGYLYNTKAISQSNSCLILKITNKGSVAYNKPQRAKSAVTTMQYNSGDQLLYKGISGDFSTIVTDKPNQSKTTNFEFVECKDADGNNYSVVKIGSQTWMAENLKTTKFQSGISIPNISDADQWTFIDENSAYCVYNNQYNNALKYGYLYNWFAVNNSQNISPIGWHISTDTDWTTLSNTLDGLLGAGSKLKESGVINWKNVNTGNNESGFTALPGGFRDESGGYSYINMSGYWWSSTESNTFSSWSRYIYSNMSELFVDGNFFSKKRGFSVRCVKDELPILTTTLITDITLSTAVGGGVISDSGSSSIISSGICWSTSHNPTTLNSISTNGSGLFSFSCNISSLSPGRTYYVRAFATNSQGTAYGDELSFTTNMPALGDVYLNGYIFYLDNSGMHGLICALNDQVGTFNWHNGQYYNINATSAGVNSGSSNTTKIIDIQGNSGNYAALSCRNLSPSNTWFLPSKDELNLMYINLKSNGKGNFSNSARYWSSTQDDRNGAWCQLFKYGTQEITLKENLYNVRAVRSF